MGIDINKIVENALVESDKKEILTENEEVKNSETNSEITLTEEDEKIANVFNELFSIAESTAFASGLGALTFRSQLKSLSEATKNTKKTTNLKKKIGIGIGSGLAAAGAGYAAYKNKDKLGDMAQQAGSAIKSTTKNVVRNINSKINPSMWDKIKSRIHPSMWDRIKSKF